MNLLDFGSDLHLDPESVFSTFLSLADRRIGTMNSRLHFWTDMDHESRFWTLDNFFKFLDSSMYALHSVEWASSY